LIPVRISIRIAVTLPPRPEAPVSPSVPDAVAGNWVDTLAPAALRPYLRLARIDRPIGTWLLLFPCWWSQALAEIHTGIAVPNVEFLLLFAIGAFVMRGCGCAYNDFVDRDYDAKVERTRNRPIPSGQVSPWAALLFSVTLAFVGLAVLVQFNTFTIVLAIGSLLLVAIYPFMKRFTYWPQLVLGLAFNWGALVGWSAVTGSIAAAPVMLYLGSVMWTLGYDTIYAHQDAEDDLMAGLKSTALRFGDASPLWVAGFYAATIALWTLAGLEAGAPAPYFIGVTVAGAHFAWQVATLDIHDAANCLTRFRSNRTAAAILFVGLLACYPML
jgi:4-hydroxybenzoate polyprenyltransferase